MSTKIKSKTSGNLTNYVVVAILFCMGLFMGSCNRQTHGFALPEGDIEEGKVVYKELICNECHSISEIAWIGGRDSLNIPLGGVVSIQKSYGELVTSVINPSHRIARRYKNEATEGGLSKMVNYNDVMTVEELIDLVAFLQSEYKIESPPTDYYPYHY